MVPSRQWKWTGCPALCTALSIPVENSNRVDRKDSCEKEQFVKFYWKTLRKVLIGLMNEGCVPLIFAESIYDSRLEIIADLPPKTVIWWFEKVDMSQAKEILGDTACIMGNVPNILFRSGTPDDIEACCKELIDVAGKEGGYILSTAAGMQGAKPENVKAMMDFVKKYVND